MTRDYGAYSCAAHPLPEPTTAAQRAARERNLAARRRLGLPERGTTNLHAAEAALARTISDRDDVFHSPEERLLAAVLALDKDRLRRRIHEGGKESRAKGQNDHELAPRNGVVPEGSPEAAAIIRRYRTEAKGTLRERRKPKSECSCGFCLPCIRRLERAAERGGPDRKPARSQVRRAERRRKAVVPRESKPKPEGEPCACGCGELASPGARFRQGHATRLRVKTPEGRAAQAAAATSRWGRENASLAAA